MSSSQQLLADTMYIALSLPLRRTRSCFMHGLNLCTLLGLNVDYKVLRIRGVVPPLHHVLQLRNRTALSPLLASTYG